MARRRRAARSRTSPIAACANWGWRRPWSAGLTERAPPAPLHSLLCCALALMCAPDDTPPYEAFTVVDQTVTAAAADPVSARAKGMVNAVLRRFLRERETLLQQARQTPLARWNYPQWWIDAVRAAWPRDWQRILEVGNIAAPLTLRVNRRHGSVADYLQLLAAHGLAASQIGPDAVRLQRPLPVAQIPGFERGLVSVQDAAAQLAAPLLDLRDGMRVLDACAAPGGKSGHLLECAQVDLLALDSDAARLAKIDDNLRRLDLTATLKHGDAAAGRLVGRRAVRPHPGRRAVHRLRHRAPPSGHPLAAAQERYRAIGGAGGAHSRQSLAHAGAGW